MATVAELGRINPVADRVLEKQRRDGLGKSRRFYLAALTGVDGRLRERHTAALAWVVVIRQCSEAVLADVDLTIESLVAESADSRKPPVEKAHERF
jgi:hypothetical protein